jgi:hypothetical protein
MLNFMEIRPVKAELFNAGGGTDTTKLIVAFRYFAYSRKNAVNCVTHIQTVTILAGFTMPTLLFVAGQ